MNICTYFSPINNKLPYSRLCNLKVDEFNNQISEMGYNFHLIAKHVLGKTNILADCISRMHDLPFCEQFLRVYVQPPLYLQDLVRHMSSNALRFLLFRLPGIKGGEITG